MIVTRMLRLTKKINKHTKTQIDCEIDVDTVVFDVNGKEFGEGISPREEFTVKIKIGRGKVTTVDVVEGKGYSKQRAKEFLNRKQVRDEIIKMVKDKKRIHSALEFSESVDNICSMIGEELELMFFKGELI